jgi:hypothetical protein
MARTGLRMMPTFPSPPLKSVRRVFPGTAPRPDYQTRPSQQAGLPSSFVLLAAIRYSLLCVRDDALMSTSVRADQTALPQGPTLRSGLCCPGPSSLNRPHPPHSRAHPDFTVSRLIRDAFAVPIGMGLGDPRLVLSFPRCSCATCHPL